MAATQSKYRAYLSHSEPITANQLIVEYDNTSYQVEKDSYGGYGNNGLIADSGSSGLPFYIRSEENDQTVVYTSSAGQHTIKISEYTSKVETTECFKKAVKSAGGGVMMLNLVESDSLSIEGATWQEAYDALQNGTMVYLKRDGGILPCGYFDNFIIGFDTTIISAASQVINTISIVWNASGSISDQSRVYPQS